MRCDPMDLLFRPDQESTLRVVSHSGSWYATLTACTDIHCSHGYTHHLEINYKREFTSHDEGTILNAFETTLRAMSATTQEQRMNLSNAVNELVACLSDEAVFSTFVDPCVIPDP